MPDSGRIDVFLSYSKVDAALAAELAHAFEQSGISIWWDAYLRPGEPFEEAGKSALLQTKIILGILSASSLQSPWVRWELTHAHEQGLRVVLLLAGGLLQKGLPTPLRQLPAFSIDNALRPGAIQETVDSIRTILAGVPREPGQADAESSPRLLASFPRGVGIEPMEHFPGLDGDDSRDYLCSNGFQAFLRAQDISIAFTAFPLSLLFFVRQDSSEREMLAVSRAPDVRAVHAGRGRLLLGCETCIEELAISSTAGESLNGERGQDYILKSRYVTGPLDVHDLTFFSGDCVAFVNTRYSCLSSISPGGSVQTIWKPPFISRFAPEDRCHLNGIAIMDGKPAWASAAAATDVIDGWREHRADGGIVIDIVENRVICSGLSMPHSPRFHEARLWILNSGSGELGVIQKGPSGEARFETHTFIPGFLRGLTFVGPYAIVGVSKPRHGVFQGLPLLERLQERRLPPWSGLAVIDTRNGRCVEWFRLTGRVWEVSDVAVLPGVSRPSVMPLPN